MDAVIVSEGFRSVKVLSLVLHELFQPKMKRKSTHYQLHILCHLKASQTKFHREGKT